MTSMLRRCGRLEVDTAKLDAHAYACRYDQAPDLPRDTSLDTSWWQDLTGTTPLSVTETLSESRS